QIGTGSTDFLLNLMHDLRINMFGINTSLTYKINTANSSGYKYGNKVMANLIGYYRFRFGGVSVSPNTGLIFEHTEANNYSNQKVQYTGGHVLSALAGVEFSYNKIAVGFNVQQALVQDYAGGQTNMKFRGMAHISFAF
ncbi:MAG TPA: transporter, partial [Puia sp.]|nr:transporter [Puia sp.]